MSRRLKSLLPKFRRQLPEHRPAWSVSEQRLPLIAWRMSMSHPEGEPRNIHPPKVRSQPLPQARPSQGYLVCLNGDLCNVGSHISQLQVSFGWLAFPRSLERSFSKVSESWFKFNLRVVVQTSDWYALSCTLRVRMALENWRRRDISTTNSTYILLFSVHRESIMNSWSSTQLCRSSQPSRPARMANWLEFLGRLRAWDKVKNISPTFSNQKNLSSFCFVF